MPDLKKRKAKNLPKTKRSKLDVGKWAGRACGGAYGSNIVAGHNGVGCRITAGAVSKDRVSTLIEFNAGRGVEGHGVPFDSAAGGEGVNAGTRPAATILVAQIFNDAATSG
jgi:hypothetical protein